MPINWFDNEKDTGNGSKPFLDEFLEENPKANGKTFVMTSLRPVKSGKGYLLDFDSFIAFIWKKEKTTVQLLEALELYCEQQDGFAIVCMVNNKLKNKFVLGVDFDSPTSWFVQGKNSYSIHESDSITQAPTSNNPFLPVPSSPSPLDPSWGTPTSPDTSQNGRGEKGTVGKRRTAPQKEQ